MPPHQSEDLACALANAGIDSSLYQILVIPNNDHHSFRLWIDLDGQVPQHRVRDDVLAFLDDHFKNPP